MENLPLHIVGEENDGGKLEYIHVLDMENMADPEDVVQIPSSCNVLTSTEIYSKSGVCTVKPVNRMAPNFSRSKYLPVAVLI